MQKVAFPHARILVVDDELINVRVLERVLTWEGYTNVIGLTDPRDVFVQITQQEPDLILLDLMMPDLSGFEVMTRLGALLPEGVFLPILILTADVTSETRRSALAGAAMDFLTKPFDPVEIALRVRNLLTARWFHLQLREQNQRLEMRVRERTEALTQAHREILQRLARAAEFRDDATGEHARRVSHITALLAEALGLDAAEVTLIRQAAPLHDVGKIGISDRILLKPGKLTPAEYAAMQAHTTIGAALLAGGDSALVQLAEQIALTHHERWDGAGYPRGLAGERIPHAGRLVAIADVFDALTHVRPYKDAWSVAAAVEEIRHERGRHFDPEVVDAFLRLPHQSLV
jgi:putative two-component system response regulator